MLRERIKKEMREALKQGEEDKLRALRLVNSSVLNREKEKRYKIAREKEGLSGEELEEKSRLNDEEMTEVLFSEIKKRKESIVEFEKGGREDLVRKEQAEIDVLEEYLPEQLSEAEVREKAEETINRLGAEGMKDMGRVMGRLMPEVKGRADGETVGRAVKELLSEG